MSSWLIHGGTLLTPDGEIRDAAVVVAEGRVAYAGAADLLPERLRAASGREIDVRAVRSIDAGGAYVAPGFVDVHVHGGGGVEVMDGTVDALAAMGAAHARQGTTAFLATTWTESPERLVAAARAVGRAIGLWEDARERAAGGEEAAGPPPPFEKSAAVVGLHLEGPYINPKRPGAQDGAHIRQSSTAELERLMDAVGGAERLRLITIAPERPGALPVIRWLKQHGVTVSMGHTDATFEEALAAVDAGVTHVTHCYNAMRGLHHRDPGVVGAVLTSGRVTAELIADGIHVHPGAMRALYEAKGARGVALVTDAVRAMGMPDGTYDIGGREVILSDGAVRLPDGTLAGSALSTARAVRTVIEQVGVPPFEAVHMASLAPARSVGLDRRKGSLVPGKDADLVLLGRNFDVRLTMVEGRVVFEDERDAAGRAIDEGRDAT